MVLKQADKCIPKLNEGDQIVLINGRDISEHTHDQVVMFIKASRESHTRELALLVRRKGNWANFIHFNLFDKVALMLGGIPSSVYINIFSLHWEYICAKKQISLHLN